MKGGFRGKYGEDDWVGRFERWVGRDLSVENWDG